MFEVELQPVIEDVRFQRIVHGRKRLDELPESIQMTLLCLIGIGTLISGGDQAFEVLLDKGGLAENRGILLGQLVHLLPGEPLMDIQLAESGGHPRSEILVDHRHQSRDVGSLELREERVALVGSEFPCRQPVVGGFVEATQRSGILE